MVIDDKFLNVLMVGMKNMKRDLSPDHPLHGQVIELMNFLSVESLRIDPPNLTALNAALQDKGWGTVSNSGDKVDISGLTIPQ